MKTLSIIIPFLNEENTILHILKDVMKVSLDKYTFEIILVNDGSSDSSVEKINSYISNYKWKYKIRLLDYSENKWKWFALKQWIEKSSWDLIIVQDADMEYTPDDYKWLIAYLERHKKDFVYWSRILWVYKYKNHYSNKIFLCGGLFVSIITSLLTLKKITDEPTCYKLFKKELKPFLLLPEENWFEWEPAITMILLRKKFSFWEFPIHYFPRDVAHWKKINWKDWVKAIIILLKWRFKKINIWKK